MGVPAYIELQLHPERIADGRVEARIAALPTLGMSNAQLYARFEEPVREARKKLKSEKADGVDERGLAAQAARHGPARKPPTADPRGPDGRPRRARRRVRAAVERSARRLLDEPLQRLREQGRGPDPGRVLRARRHPAAHLGPVRGPAARDRRVAGDALLPRQRPLRRRRGAPPRRIRARRHVRRPYGGREGSEGPERELRPRAHGAPHARRGRRLHAEGRHRARARADGLVDLARPRRRAGPLRLPRAPARRGVEGRPRTAVSRRRRHGRGRAGDPHAGAPARDGPPHRLPALPAPRGRRASPGARRAGRAAIPRVGAAT